MLQLGAIGQPIPPKNGQGLRFDQDRPHGVGEQDIRQFARRLSFRNLRVLMDAERMAAVGQPEGECFLLLTFVPIGYIDHARGMVEGDEMTVHRLPVMCERQLEGDPSFAVAFVVEPVAKCRHP